MDIQQIIADPTLSPEAKVILVTGEIEKQGTPQRAKQREGIMDNDYIFIQGEGETGIFLKESTVTSVRYDLATSTAVITTSDSDECYTVVGVLAVHQLHDHFYQYSKLKLWTDKKEPGKPSRRGASQ